MATGNKSSPDLNDALDLFVGDTRVSGKEPSSPHDKKKPVNSKSADNKRKPVVAVQAEASMQRSKSEHAKQPAEKGAETAISADQKAQTDRHSTDRPTTRMGRPPGIRSGSGRPKDKTSLSLDLELMDRYRDQSWQEQCQLGELVERALRDYAVRTWEWKFRE